MNSHPIWGVSRSQKDKIGKDHIGIEIDRFTCRYRQIGTDRLTDIRADIDR